MRKLGLVIPSKLYSFNNLKFYFVIIFIHAISCVTQAQIYGCHIRRHSTEVIYYTPYGTGSPSEWITTGVIDRTGAEGGFREDGTASFGCIKDIGMSCTIYQQYLLEDGVTIATRIYSSGGVFASISPVNCPIDDYIPILFIFTAGLALITITNHRPSLYMKISIITVVYNAENYIKYCIESILNQQYQDIEYIVIDGGSTDNTLTIINQYADRIHHLVSEKDEGLYDAINKGIKLATGAVIGILNADDELANNDVIGQVAATFIQNPTIDGVYGDLHYIKPVSKKIVRKWISKQATEVDVVKGWMPAHPTLYIKSGFFKTHGNYALDMGTAADYDLILRYFYVNKIKANYLPILMVNMRTGGVSNKSIYSRITALGNDYKALIRNKLPNPMVALFLKKFNKFSQF